MDLLIGVPYITVKEEPGFSFRIKEINLVMIIGNSGQGMADGITFTAATLSSTAALPSSVPAPFSLNPGASKVVTLQFPLIAVPPGTQTTLTISGTYTDGTFSRSIVVIAP